METKEFKRITKYDEFTVDEFVKAYNEAEENFKAATADMDSKITEVDAKIAELNSKNTRKMTPEEKEAHKTEKEQLRKEKSGYGKEKTQAKNYFAKYEKEKLRIHERLSKEIEKIEGKIEEKKSEIKNYEEEIKTNEEKLDNMDKKLPEYDELVLASRALERKITSLRGAITKHEAKIVLIKESQGNLEKNKHLGLKQNIKNEPRRENKKYKTKGERYKEYLEKKAKTTGYYTHARTAQEDENFKMMDDTAKKLKEKNDAKLRKEVQDRKKAEAAKNAANKKSESKTKKTKTVGNKKVETKAEPAKTAETKKVETKAEPAKTAETKKVETKAEPAKTTETKKVETKAEPEKADETKTTEKKVEPERTEIDNEIARLEDEIKKSAARMREYKENGNYNQEALEHEYYNSLIAKMNNLNNAEPELKWHSKLTEEQIMYAKENDIYEPQGPEYEQFLTQLGIKENSVSVEKEEKTSFLKRMWSKASDFFKKIGNNIKEKVKGIGKSDIKLLDEGKKVGSNEETKTSESDSKKFKDYYRVDEKWVRNEEGLHIPIEYLKDDDWVINEEGLATPKKYIKVEEETR